MPLTDELNQVSVPWYAVATPNLAEYMVERQLIRTIPTSYNPNRPPGQLDFTILAMPPGATQYEVNLHSITYKEWMGLGLAAGLWRSKAFAKNAYMAAFESEVVQLGRRAHRLREM